MKTRLGVLAMVLLLSACAQTNADKNTALNNLFVVKPQTADLRYQLEIAKLNEILSHEDDIGKESLAQLLYRRGSLYDAVGLNALARIDFNYALEFNPRLSGAYNYLGIHYTQAQQFNYAYEMFDSALELEPDHPYAKLNRGIVSYYDQRYDLAYNDLFDFYDAEQSDPYRVLWLYLAEVNDQPEVARRNLAQRRIADGNGEWGWNLVDVMLGAIDEETFIDIHAVRNLQQDETLAERMCEAYFYLGKLKQLQGNHRAASVYFRLALSTNVYIYLEHRYAGLELERSEEAISANSE